MGLTSTKKTTVKWRENRPGFLSSGAFLFLSVVAMAPSVAGVATSCNSCVSCSKTDAQGSQILADAISGLGSEDSLDMYMDDGLDSLTALTTKFGGACPEANPDLTSQTPLPGTPCVNAFFTVWLADNQTSQFCKILGPLSNFFLTSSELGDNVTDEDLVTALNSWTAEDITTELQKVTSMDAYAGSRLTGDVALCSAVSDCNLMPTNDVTTVEQPLGAWDDAYNDPTSTASQNAVSAGAAICGKMTGASDCSSTVEMGLSSSKRQRRSNQVAVLVFTIEFPPLYVAGGSGYQQIYAAAVVTAKAEASGTLATFMTANVDENAATATVVVGIIVVENAAPELRTMSVFALIPLIGLLTFREY